MRVAKFLAVLAVVLCLRGSAMAQDLCDTNGVISVPEPGTLLLLGAGLGALAIWGRKRMRR